MPAHITTLTFQEPLLARGDRTQKKIKPRINLDRTRGSRANRFYKSGLLIFLAAAGAPRFIVARSVDLFRKITYIPTESARDEIRTIIGGTCSEGDIMLRTGCNERGNEGLNDGERWIDDGLRPRDGLFRGYVWEDSRGVRGFYRRRDGVAF